MNYYVVLNSDRVHISSEGIPVQTLLFSTYGGGDPIAGRTIAVGLAVCKALELNDGTKVQVIDKRVKADGQLHSK